MELVMIACPHCSQGYLTVLQDQNSECPICHKMVSVKVTPVTVEITKGSVSDDFAEKVRP